MEDLNADFLDVCRKEAEACVERGDMENARAIYDNILKISFPIVEEQIRKDPKIIFAIMAEAAQPGPPGEAAQVLLNYLDKKGLVP